MVLDEKTQTAGLKSFGLAVFGLRVFGTAGCSVSTYLTILNETR